MKQSFTFVTFTVSEKIAMLKFLPRWSMSQPADQHWSLYRLTFSKCVRNWLCLPFLRGICLQEKKKASTLEQLHKKKGVQRNKKSTQEQSRALPSQRLWQAEMCADILSQVSFQLFNSLENTLDVVKLFERKTAKHEYKKRNNSVQQLRGQSFTKYFSVCPYFTGWKLLSCNSETNGW